MWHAPKTAYKLAQYMPIADDDLDCDFNATRRSRRAQLPALPTVRGFSAITSFYNIFVVVKNSKHVRRVEWKT